MEEGMTNILAVQSLGGMEVQKRHFASRSSDSYAAYLSLFALQLGAHGPAVLAIVAAATYIFFTVTDLTIAGIFTAGDLTVLYILYAQIFGAGLQLALLWMKQQDNLAGLRRVFFVLDLPAEEDPPGSAELSPIRQGVSFEDVGFRYGDGTEALKGVNLEARVGEMVALVGVTGAGKTTVASMIPRFLCPGTGTVRIDGQDIAGVRLDSLRAQIAFVFQESVLFDASVEENIRVANPRATDADVRRAARSAGADEFIARLPQGYRTPLGVAGGKLSVGQKQRLSIARALVRDAPILILDEPTSALDPETEQQLVKSLRDASRSRLVLVIAHRLSTIRAADQILFLQDGRILERGTHAELMTRSGGAYRAFTMLQTRSVA
jgi:ABC-type multidrug transport system fused ATPase/permease subunit